jgi:hypothetical protein
MSRKNEGLNSVNPAGAGSRRTALFPLRWFPEMKTTRIFDPKFFDGMTG